MGRPPKEINWEIVEKRMQAGETAVSIASRHFIDPDTFYKRFKKQYGFSFGDRATRFREVGKSDILFIQYMKALSGNIRMLELLGREWCGQGKNEISQSPFEDILFLRHENMLLKAKLDAMENKDDDKSQAE